MLAETLGQLPLWQAYAALYAAGSVFILILSFPMYMPLYKWASTKDKAARWKTILRYPADETINREIVWAFIGLAFGLLNPLMAVFFQKWGWNRMYSDMAQYGYGYWAFSWLCLFFYTEIFQYLWHRACHTYPMLWDLHKVHHKFHNPSPISVIANHPLDIIMQASPLFVFPLIMPIHDMTLMLTYAAFNYGYGAYLHSGFDWPFAATSPHSSWFITNYHHVMHHHASHFGKPLNTGFVLNIFDKLGGTLAGPDYFAKNGPCTCAHCRPADAHIKAKPTVDPANNDHEE